MTRSNSPLTRNSTIELIDEIDCELSANCEVYSRNSINDDSQDLTDQCELSLQFAINFN